MTWKCPNLHNELPENVTEKTDIMSISRKARTVRLAVKYFSDTYADVNGSLKDRRRRKSSQERDQTAFKQGACEDGTSLVMFRCLLPRFVLYVQAFCVEHEPSTETRPADVCTWYEEDLWLYAEFVICSNSLALLASIGESQRAAAADPQSDESGALTVKDLSVCV